MIPYVKGRSEAEIEHLITGRTPEPEYEVRNINLGQIYRGEYGKIVPVSKNLKRVTPCQESQHISLSQSPKGSPFYQHFISTFYIDSRYL